MEDRTEPAAKPEEFNIVLESVHDSPEARARSVQWFLIKAAMRRQPTLRRPLTISFGDQPDFFIVVDETEKG